MFSNMTLCDDRRIAFLREIDPQFINVSLYSMNEYEHDAITQCPGSWQKTVTAIRKCNGVGVRCRIATPVLKTNRNALSGVKAFADEQGLDFVPCYEIVARSDHNSENLTHACSAEEIRSVLTRDRRYFAHPENDGIMPPCDAKVCGIGEGRVYLNSKGNYYPCDSMHGYVLGNVRDDTMESIWAGEKLDRLRKLKNRNFGECMNCEKRAWCKVCPAANFNATKDIFRHTQETCALASVVQEVYGRM